MGYREEILNQLYRILDNNTTDARIYYRLADKCRRSTLKLFFKKLSLQKRIFCRRIKYEIRELEREIELISEKPIYPNEIIPKKSIPEPPSLKTDVLSLITYCYRREQQYLEIYKKLLSQTNLDSIREMLLSQKHAVQLALNEIKTFETNQNERNQGEINYS